MRASFVAPGKLVLAGEYAVIDGAPAIVAAVDRGVRCALSPAERLEIDAPDLRFVGPVLEGAPPARFAFTPWNPAPTRTKAGFGSSAAAVVAALIAREHLEGVARDPAERLSVAMAHHRGAQGSGSGIDVAASVFGGVLRFQGAAARALPDITPLVVWSGRSAATGPRVERYLAWGGRSAFVDASTAIVDAFPEDPIRALEANRLLLEAMASEAGLDYRTPALDAIGALARGAGGAAKPSGAGGGDSAVALFPDPEAAARFTLAVEGVGLIVIAVTLARAAHRAPGEDHE